MAFSNMMSLFSGIVQRISLSTGIVQWTFGGTFQWNLTCVISGVLYFAPRVAGLEGGCGERRVTSGRRGGECRELHGQTHASGRALKTRGLTSVGIGRKQQWSNMFDCQDSQDIAEGWRLPAAPLTIDEEATVVAGLSS